MIRELSGKEKARFWGYVDRRGPRECWPWLMRNAWGGAPSFGIDNARVSALQIMYKLYYSVEVPPDKAMLRTCGAHGSDCCNPHHLIVVKRGTRYGPWWKQRLKAARGDIHALADLVGFRLVPTQNGRYRLVEAQG